MKSQLKSKEQWNAEYTALCFNDPAVSGQLLPAPQNMDFIKAVQRDAIEYICSEMEEKLKALGEITRASKDVVSHLAAWRGFITQYRQAAMSEDDTDNIGYADHEIEALDRDGGALIKALER